jgi:4-amino-4-deoxy-L-arabinose transferase-like glycosyltransferase
MDAIAKLLVPAGPGPDAVRAFERRFWIFLGTMFLVRLIALVALPIDLSGDESYYWEWGRRPAWGYYSKPPGIGWLMALMHGIGIDTTAGIRFVGLGLGTASTLWLFMLGRAMYGPQAGFLAALAFGLTPAAAALHSVLTTDALLVFSWGLALVSLWKFLSSPEETRGALVALGVALAVGTLSKPMMLVFPLLAILFVGMIPGHRPRLRRPGFWAAMAAPLVALAPPLWWNYRHDWVTFGHTLEHFSSNERGWSRVATHVLAFLASEAALITPIGYFLLLAVVAGACVRWKHLGERERFLAAFCAPGLVVTLGMTLRENVNANWPAVFYLSAVVLLAAWAAGRFSAGGVADRLRPAAALGLWLAAFMCVATYAAAFAVAYRIVDLGRRDPLALVTGWKSIADRVQPLRGAVPRPRETFLVTVGHRYLTSELAFYLPDRPDVYLYGDRVVGEIDSQYDLWPTPAARRGEDALIVVAGGDGELPERLRRSFAEVEDLGVIETPKAYRDFARLHAYLGRRLLEWPAPAARAPKSATSAGR